MDTEIIKKEIMIIITISFILSIVLIFIGINFFNTYFKSKEIIHFKLYKDHSIFKINKLGRYSVCIIGGGAIENFHITIRSIKNSDLLQIKESFLKARFSKNAQIGTAYYDFYVLEVGEYLIKIESIDQLSVKHSMLRLISSFETKTAISNISILIKEYYSPYRFVIGLVLQIIGFMIFSLSIGYYLFKIGIIVPTKFRNH